VREEEQRIRQEKEQKMREETMKLIKEEEDRYLNRALTSLNRALTEP
jgi:hypothetical protein